MGGHESTGGRRYSTEITGSLWAIYTKEGALAMDELYRQLKGTFYKEYGHRDGLRFFFAPGRVNVIGEHTDYNGGYVFPAALTFGTWAVARPREDGIYCFRSTNFEQKVECHVSRIYFKEEDNWANYPKGVLNELLTLSSSPIASYLQGADILFHGNIPIGAGLSSSASIEVVTALLLTNLASIEIPMIELVKLAQRAENQFVGVQCGIMDQFAISMGKKENAIMLKCDTLEYSYVPLRTHGYKLVITNTNKRRGLAGSKYNERRVECEAGLRIIQKEFPNTRTIGDIRYEQWEKIRHLITDETIRRRVEHVVSENERVLLAKNSLQNGNIEEFGRLMIESHESLRDFYEVTGTELDTLFDEARKIEGCIGTRMTGAGFGGCTVSLVKEQNVEEFKDSVARNYTIKTGLFPTFYVCDIGDGAKEIKREADSWQF
jgi:galactokinase